MLNGSIGNSKKTQAQNQLKEEQKAKKKPISGMLYGCVGLGLASVVLLGTTVMFASKVSSAEMQAKQMAAKLEESLKPKYNEVNDFLTDQCQTDGVYCLSTETRSPSLEILKFLVNFRETEGYQYRLFFEVSVGKKGAEQPYKLSCEGADADFYICQEITAKNPTDVMRAFEKSYKTLSTNGLYNFNLMVKPIGEVEVVQNVTMKVEYPVQQQGATPPTTQSQNLPHQAVNQP